MFDLESIGESQIGIGQWSAMILARHQLAREEVTHTNIGDKRFAVNVLRRGVELAADIVAFEAARGRRN